jgi:mRNA deadenylase 3'-5' endonuclease subunit Ccr4
VSGVYTLLSTGSLDSRQRHHPAQWRRFLSRPSPHNTSSYSESEDDEDSSRGNTSEQQQQQHAELSSSGLSLNSAYLAARGAEPPLTNKHPGFAGCLDYVWCSPATFDVLGTLAMPYETLGYAQVPHSPYAVPFDNIPNGVWPSDHLAVGAVLQFKQTEGDVQSISTGL